ncbi:MAG: sigma-70 family RNA polymerase sigma factor [Deltaproteobacteria bacterium]
MQLPFDSGISAEDSPCTSTRAAERRRAFETARADWPALRVRFEDFYNHLERLGFEHGLPPQVSSLYLCVACSQGCAIACKQLEAKYFPPLRAFVARFDPRPDVVDELLQQIRYRLLVGPAPRIGTYRGEGSFDGWLRKVAHTIAVDSIRINIGRERRSHRLGQDAGCVDCIHAAAPPPPDEHLHRERYASIVQRALHQSVHALPSEQRQLLHHYYVSGLSIDQLGAMYACNRSTAARRIVRSVRMIQRALRKELSQHLGTLGGGELESWVPVLYRRWGVDMGGWLES